MPVAARWGDRQHTAGRLDPKLPLMLFNGGNHLPNRRSGFTCAKYAEAFLTIPLAWRSCLFPRSNAFSRTAPVTGQTVALTGVSGRLNAPGA